VPVLAVCRVNRYFICKTGISLIERMKREAVALISIESMVSRLLEDVNVSAESSTLARLNPQRGDFVRFLCTPGELPELQAQALCEYYRHQGQLSAYTVTQLPRGEKADPFYRMLNTLMKVTHCAQILNYLPEIIVTSGFKHEAIALAVAGLVDKIPVRYLADAGAELYTLPELPLGWDVSFYEKHQTVFESTNKGEIDSYALDNLLHRYSELKPYFQKDQQGEPELSILGEILRYLWYMQKIKESAPFPYAGQPEAPFEDLVTGALPDLSDYSQRLIDTLSRQKFVRGVSPIPNAQKTEAPQFSVRIEHEGKEDTFAVMLTGSSEEEVEFQKQVLSVLL
jgi:hypothetical protein